MVFRGRETDLYQTGDNGVGLQLSHQATLLRLGREARAEAETLPVSFDHPLVAAGGNHKDSHIVDVTFVPIMASDEESLGLMPDSRERRAVE